MTSEVMRPQLVRRPSQLVADELRAMILHGELRDAEGLSEQGIAGRLGVSRHHLREALRLLEQDGLVRVRSGRNGGVFITVPGVAALARTFSNILGANATPLHDLMAARLVVEPAAAAIAATEATDAEIVALEVIVARQAEADRYVYGLNSQFHVTLAAAAHNQTLLLMMRSIEEIIRTIDALEPILFTGDIEEVRNDSADGSYRAHRAIVRALKERDPARVADLVRRHLIGFEQRLREIGLDPLRHTVADVLQASNRAYSGRTNGQR